jgi:hypothetical protein
MQKVPFLLEDKLKELGAKFERGDADWGAHVVTDGRLVTGQNPGSSTQVAKVAIQVLEKSKGEMKEGSQAAQGTAGTGGMASKEELLEQQQARELAPEAAA